MEKKTVLITGASSGIGKELAYQYARNNCQVFLTARREKSLQAIVEKINQGKKEKIAAYKAFDIKDHEATKECSREVLQTFGQIDLLICNAGVGKNMSVTNFSTDIIKELYEVNVFGVLQMIEAFLPHMMKQKKGHIVAISSLAAYESFPKNHPYCATKAAIRSHMEGLSKELKAYGVSISCICPGFIKTDMTASNKHPMPFLMELDKATHKIYKAIEQKKEVYNFPWQSYYGLRLLQCVPKVIKNYLKF